MKQTIVEQLGIAFRQWQKDWENFEETGKYKPLSYDEFIEPFLEMEKQQQGYSKEDMKEAFQVGFNVGYNDETSPSYLTAEKFVEQFKNK